MFMTTRTTLCRDPKSFLYRLCQEDPDLNSDKVGSTLCFWKMFRQGPPSVFGRCFSKLLLENRKNSEQNLCKLEILPYANKTKHASLKWVGRLFDFVGRPESRF